MANKKKELKARSGGADGSQQYTSPSARATVSRYKAGDITANEAVDSLGGKGQSPEIRSRLAKAIGTQNAEIIIAEIFQEVRARKSPKTQTRKPGFAKGGMVKKANCGASMKPTQKASKGK